MINVVGSTPMPASPLPPDLPGELPVDPTQTAPTVDSAEPATSTGGTLPPSNTKPLNQPLKKKTSIPKKKLMAGLILLLLLLGGGVGMYLIKLNQDLRQQASVYGDTCSPSSDATCQGVEFNGNCLRNGGTCRPLRNQEAEDGIPCTCDRGGEDPTPTPTTRPTPTPTPPTRPTPTPTPGETPTCTVALNPSTFTVAPGAQKGFAAVVTVQNGTIRDVNFRSLDETIATVSPDQDTTTPYRTAATALQEGTVTIRANARTNRGENCVANATLTINAAEPTPTPTPTGELTPTPTPTPAPGEPTATPVPADDPTPTPTTDSGAADNNLADAGETGGTSQTQPTLPSTLPQTGPEDWLKYLQIGLGVLGAGALLLLFL